MKGLAALCLKVNTTTLDQGATLDDMSPKAWLKEFGRFVETKKFVIKLPILPEHPALTFYPGDKEPDFDKLSYHLMTRFKKVPTAQITFVAAKPEARKLFGGCCHGLPKKSSAFHDALLAALFLSLDERTQQHLWVPEAKLMRWHRRPDALILDANGHTKGTVIDIGGRYSPSHLSSGHEAWKNQRYQIW